LGVLRGATVRSPFLFARGADCARAWGASFIGRKCRAAPIWRNVKTQNGTPRMRLVRDEDEADMAIDELEPTEQADAEHSPAGEPPDGAVQDAAEDTAEEQAESPSIDLGLLEALLMGTHHPLTAGRLAELMELESTKPIRKAIKELNSRYEQSARSFRIEQVAGGYQILTLPQYGDSLKRLHQREIDAKLTKAALETLAIIAYKQPILRADIEAIRGVACGETIRSLMEKHLVKIAGRAEEPGRPILYGTTKRFLELFGLNTLKDLPQAEEAKG
jgi:segregation and condensation protein B